MKTFLFLIILTFIYLPNNSAMAKQNELLILSIEKIESTNIYIIRAIDDDCNLFKIISIEENCDCFNNEIKIDSTYSLNLFSVFSGISLGNSPSKYTIYGTTIETEPENGYFDLYNSPNLKGLCIMPHPLIE